MRLVAGVGFCAGLRWYWEVQREEMMGEVWEDHWVRVRWAMVWFWLFTALLNITRLSLALMIPSLFVSSKLKKDS